ncbi:MAG: MerR family transcriptional regulator [Clostridia bacterium]|nr:MerR family transcriptional regulator [Clostridia bacterium]
MYRIGTFSKINKVTIKTLRYYDEVGLLKPAFIDEENGFRYYTSEQLLRLHRIIALRQIGFSIQEISAVLNGQNITGIFEGRKRELKYCFVIYHDGEYREKDIDVEFCEAVTAFGKDTDTIKFKKIEKVPVAACVYHKGPYSTIRNAYAYLFKWIEDNGYTPCEGPRESYINGIWKFVL